MIKVIGEKDIIKTRYFTIKNVDIEYPKGKTSYQILEKRDTSMIVALTPELKIYFIKEFFVAINQYTLTLPKGRIDEGADEYSTANKELQEEIGFKANKLEKIAILTMSPGYLTQKTHIFLAQDLVENKLPGDELEELQVMKYSFPQVEELIQKGEINEARVIAAIYLVKRKLH